MGSLVTVNNSGIRTQSFKIQKYNKIDVKYCSSKQIMGDWKCSEKENEDISEQKSQRLRTNMEE